jgi:transposase
MSINVVGWIRPSKCSRCMVRMRARERSRERGCGEAGPCVLRESAKVCCGVEATPGAHYWARVIGSFGHEVRLIGPQFVKPPRSSLATRLPTSASKPYVNYEWMK